MKRIAALLLLVCTFAYAQNFDGKTWWSYVSTLAADNMDGRETGSAGLKRAEAWLVDELKKSNLAPAGERGGYYQTITFVERSINEKNSNLALVRDGEAEPLTLGEHAFFGTRIDLAPQVDVPLVFAGYGLSIPEKNYDDLAGLDVKGKVAVVVAGAPGDIPGALAAHAQSAKERWAALRKAGAVGIVNIPNPDSMDIPWARMSLNRTHPSMAIAAEEFNETSGQKLAVTVNPVHAQKWFEGSGHTWDEVLAVLRAKKQLPRFVLPISIRARTELQKRTLTSDNIVAVIPGSDAKLKSEYIVVSAHIDHIGIGEPINGDRIYNGAMDNGSGSAALLDIARSFTGEKPRRSLLFVWVVGEEKGLLGSKYFAAHPTVPKQQIVGNVNMDMFLPIIPLKVLTVYGLNESSLGDLARAAAEKQGVGVQLDPQPQRNSFIRSDQYSFIRRGVPSLMIAFGSTKGSKEEEIAKQWLTNRYHAPSDDLNQPVDMKAAGQYNRLMMTIAEAVANNPSRPKWKADSFFRRFAQ